MMLQQHAVLTISNRRAIRHLIEEVCRGAGVETVTVASGYEAQAMAEQGGLHAFGLVVMDTIDTGKDTLSPPRRACQLLQEWTTASPLLPFVFIGPVSHKPALLRLRADIVRFVATPVGLLTLWEAMVSSLPRATRRARNCPVSYDRKGISHGRHHHRSDHPHLSRRDPAVRYRVARGTFFAAGSD